MFLFSFLLTPIAKYAAIGIALLLLIGGAYLYVKITNDEIKTLTQKITVLTITTQSLQAVNTKLQTDYENIKKLQDQTNQTLSAIRTQSRITEQRIRNEILNSSNPTQLQIQVNKDMANTFQELENLSK